MRLRSAIVAVVLLAWAGAAASVHAEVVIETVTVGNPGNADDTHGDGYGGVDYVYNIGKFEITAGQYTEFLNAVAATDTYDLYNTLMWHVPYYDRGCRIQRHGSPGSYIYSVAADWADRPVNYVGWGDSARFSNWMHNGQGSGDTETGSYYLNGAMTNTELVAVTREADATWVIPSEDEWYKAAYHYNDGVTGNYFDFPTSSDSVPGYVNDSGDLSGTGTPFTEGGTDPGNYVTYDGDGVTSGIGSPYYRTAVGEWENSDSPYSTFDQGGNVWEWNEAIVYGWHRGLRGGSFSSGGDILPAWYRYSLAAAYGMDFLGFRVAEVPDCNANGVPDHLDIEDGTSDDCQPNDIPDECDIADGASADDNGNGIPDECEISTHLDIKPGSCPNPVNARSKGVVPMAIVGSESFDVTQIGVGTLTLRRADGVGGLVAPLSGPPGPGITTDDVATTFAGDLCDCHGLGGDGIDDLLLKFSTPELAGAFQLSELPSGASMMLILSGSLLDGTAFEASDCVVIPGKSPLARKRGSRKRE